MKEVILTNPEQGGELFIICCHKLSLWWRSIGVGLTACMGDLQNVVNIFDRSEPFGIKVQDRGSFQLRETSLKMQLDRVGAPSFPTTDLRVNKS